MGARVSVRVNGDETIELVPGDIVGRMWSSALKLDDPLVSEAHALVSLREGALKLLGLRGALSVGGKTVTEIVLSPGLQIRLSPRSCLHVLKVSMPDTWVALELPCGGRSVLTGPVSLITRPRVALDPGANPDAAAVIWSDGKRWYARESTGQNHDIVPGTALLIQDLHIPVVEVSAAAHGEGGTDGSRSPEGPLEIHVRYETVHIHRSAGSTVVIDGLGARILSELAVAGVPLGWQTLAADLWRDESDLPSLRRKWDAALVRLRRKLREARLRTDLVRTDHHGNFELFLAKGDKVDDQT